MGQLRRRSTAEKINQKFRNAGWFFMLEPMGRIGKREEFGVRAVAQTFVRHFSEEKGVALSPEDAGGHADGLVREFDAGAEERPVPVDHGSEDARLGPRGAVLGEIFLGECAPTAGAEKRSRTNAEIKSREKRFRQPRELEEKHVPAAEKLARPRAEELAHHGRVRDVEDNKFGNALRMQQGGAPGDGGSPVMSGEKDCFLAELVGDRDDVGNEFRDGVSCYSQRRAAEVVATLVGHDDAKSCRGQRLDLPAPAIPEFRKAVEENDNGAVLGAGSDGM